MQTNNSKEKVRQLQNKLYLTAKKCDSRRFHALYDKVYRDDVLFEAWKRVKSNKGSSGVDGIKIEDVEAMGIDFLGMHHRRMTTETRKGQLYKETYQYPSRKAMKKMKAEVKRNVNSRSLLVAKEEVLIKNLNPKITGWKNYYTTKTSNKWMQALDWYIICTFTRWYNKKHQRRNRMSKVGYVRSTIYGKGLKRMATA